MKNNKKTNGSVVRSCRSYVICDAAGNLKITYDVSDVIDYLNRVAAEEELREIVEELESSLSGCPDIDDIDDWYGQIEEEEDEEADMMTFEEVLKMMPSIRINKKVDEIIRGSEELQDAAEKLDGIDREDLVERKEFCDYVGVDERLIDWRLGCRYCPETRACWEKTMKKLVNVDVSKVDIQKVLDMMYEMYDGIYPNCDVIREMIDREIDHIKEENYALAASR